VTAGIAEVVAAAVGVAISPLPIIAVILMLFSAHARVNGPMFLLGWVIGLGVVCAVVYGLASGAGASSDPSASKGISWFKLALGVVLLVLAARRWRTRPRTPQVASMPKWMAGIDTFTAGKSLGLGMLLSSVNPKNLILTAGAAAGLAQLGLPAREVTVSLVVFVALASTSIAVPVLYHLFGGQRAQAQLDEVKSWLTVNNGAVMAVLLVVFGAVLIGKGLSGV
jgi:hypothetical protein